MNNEEDDEFVLTFADIRHSPGLYETSGGGYILITREPAQGGTAHMMEDEFLTHKVLSGAVYIEELSEDFGTHIGTYDETYRNVQPVWGAGNSSFRYKRMDNMKLMLVLK